MLINARQVVRVRDGENGMADLLTGGLGGSEAGGEEGRCGDSGVVTGCRRGEHACMGESWRERSEEERGETVRASYEHD